MAHWMRNPAPESRARRRPRESAGRRLILAFGLAAGLMSPAGVLAQGSNHTGGPGHESSDGGHEHHRHHGDEATNGVDAAARLEALRSRAARAIDPVLLLDTAGAEVALPDGNVWVMTFFYGTCREVCPILLRNLATVAGRFGPEERRGVRFGAITFDPARDGPEELARLATAHGLQGAGRKILTGKPADIAHLTEAFGFSFKPDDRGGFDHVNLLAVMDGKGRTVRHFYGLTPDTLQVVRAVRNAAHNSLPEAIRR